MQIATDQLPTIALNLVVYGLSTAIHEAAHAYTADSLGDPTARALGRVTLNPFKHLSLIGSFILPVVVMLVSPGAMLMAGKPVPVQINRLRHPSRDFMLVAFAGPISNLLQALFYTALFVFLRRQGWIEPGYAYRVLGLAVTANIVLMFFNSVPIPPLDGSRFIGYLLPKTIQPWFYRIDPVGFIIVLVLIFTHRFELLFTKAIQPLNEWWMNTYTSWFV